MKSSIIRDAAFLLSAIVLAGCGIRGMKPCIPDPPPREVKQVATADIDGRYNIDSTRINQLYLFLEKVPTNSLETYWYYMFMPVDGITFKNKYESPRLFRIKLSIKQMKKLHSSMDTVLYHRDHYEDMNQGNEVELAYPPSNSTIYVAVNRTETSYRGVLRLEKENYKWMGDSLATTYRFDEKEDVVKFHDLLEEGIKSLDVFSDSSETKDSQFSTGGC